MTICTAIGSSQIDRYMEVGPTPTLVAASNIQEHWTYRITNEVWSRRRCLHVGIFDEEHGNEVFGKLICRGCTYGTLVKENSFLGS